MKLFILAACLGVALTIPTDIPELGEVTDVPELGDESLADLVKRIAEDEIVEGYDVASVHAQDTRDAEERPMSRRDVEAHGNGEYAYMHVYIHEVFQSLLSTYFCA